MIERTTTRHDASLCPNCGEMLDASTALSDPSAKPRAGDISICICCGSILQYDAALRLEMAPLDVIAEVLREQPEVVRLQKAIAARPYRSKRAGTA